MTTLPERGRFQGVAQILRFNWPMYAAAGVLLVVGAAAVFLIGMPRSFRLAAFAGFGLTAFWLLVSLGVSHYVYDRAGIYGGEWLSRALPKAPRCYANLHAGFDEFSNMLAARFPEGQAVVLDFFDGEIMTEPSIARARGLTTNQPRAQQVDFAALPLQDEELDAAFLIFAAHELRQPNARAQLLRELRRTLRQDGRIVIVEHLRDAANLLAFGPGFLHFHSRTQWLNAAAAARLKLRDEFPLTVFVRVFVFGKT